MIEGVIFDAFGTVVRMGMRANPYRELAREGRRQGVRGALQTIHVALTTDLSLEQLAAQAGIELTQAKLQELHGGLEAQLASIEPYPDAVEAIGLLHRAGVKIGICSNLASPFGPVVRSLYPNLDGYAFSYEVGAVKPTPVIYQSVCNQMAVQPGHYFSDGVGRVLMIGDSEGCDQDGPRAVGIAGFWLDRRLEGRIRDLAQFARRVVDENRGETGSKTG